VDIIRLLIELEMLAESGVDPVTLRNQAEKCEKYRMMFNPVRSVG